MRPIQVSKPISINFSIDDFCNEQMLFDASLEYANKNGGNITKFVLNKFNTLFEMYMGDYFSEENEYHIHIDTKVVMLMKGQYPCIPGWHLDAVPRDSNGNIQVSKIDPKIKHFIILFQEDGKNGPMTEFAVGEVPHISDYKELHRHVESNQGEYYFLNIQNGTLYEFNQLSIHRGVKAEENCWRYFMRASILPYPPKNKLRNQVQVYVESEDAGW